MKLIADGYTFLQHSITPATCTALVTSNQRLLSNTWRLEYVDFWSFSLDSPPDSQVNGRILIRNSSGWGCKSPSCWLGNRSESHRVWAKQAADLLNPSYLSSWAAAWWTQVHTGPGAAGEVCGPGHPGVRAPPARGVWQLL